MLVLRNDVVELAVRPDLGGSIIRFEYAGRSIFRPGPESISSVLDVASFPLVPFSGRIAGGRFPDSGGIVNLPGNFPGQPGDTNTIHGQGWLLPWNVDEVLETSARISVHHPSGAWPWSYRAEQGFQLHPKGFVHRIALTNLDARAMPAGLGVHPYFSRNAATRLVALHRGEWRTSMDGIPERETLKANPADWWNGAPVETRLVDTAYSGRSGGLRIIWPDRGLELSIHPPAALPHTVVFVPPGEAYFCVEPVSHIPNAHNSDRPRELGLRWLGAGERWNVAINFVVDERPLSVFNRSQAANNAIEPVRLSIGS